MIQHFEDFVKFMPLTEILDKPDIVLETLMSNLYVRLKCTWLTLFRMGFFGAAHECGEQKDPPP